ncbi:hypothetical protein [Micromonospora aurantiaca (nom. illeg.)]|uniref:hypothetical protein n=1 Tax=Micromonospora aurantiaca (nom. illeg.) TaxID=47850 RepID=UPI0033E7A49C
MPARTVAAVVALALLAGVAAVLALAAASDAHLNPGGAILTALAAVFVAQTIRPLARTIRNRTTR